MKKSLFDLANIPIFRGLVPEHYNCGLRCDSRPVANAPIFVFVHGTWAMKVTWTLPSSILAQTLQEEWPGSGLYRFEWSGVNGERHRLKAAEELTKIFDTLSTDFPETRIVCIAHSHGGNIVAWASTKIVRPIFAAVYLNTPFIQVLQTTPDDASRAGLRMTMFFGLNGAIFIILIDYFGLDKKTIPYILLFAFVIQIFLQKKIPPWVNRISNLLRIYSTTKRKIFKELVVNASGDEAASFLGGIYALQWLVNISIKILGLFLGVAIICAFFLPETAAINTLYGPWTLRCIIFLMLFSGIVSAGGYGLMHGLVHLDTQISVTSAPLGLVEITTMAWSDEPRLQHSVAYQSKEISYSIVGWIESISNDYRREI